MLVPCLVLFATVLPTQPDLSETTKKEKKKEKKKQNGPLRNRLQPKQCSTICHNLAYLPRAYSFCIGAPVAYFLSSLFLILV
jgi:hypothetical protein